MGLNLKLRGEILECSLNIEKEINNLLLLFLGIYSDNKETRLFGNRPGITFKNKIDLLYDLQILSKEENYDFELLMIFRNKFLHDIECNSFKNVFEQLDNGIINKYKKFLEAEESIEEEETCLTAFKRLYIKNIRVLLNKIENKKRLIDSKAELLHVFNDQNLFQIDLFFDFIRDLYLTIDKGDLENQKVQELVGHISNVCQNYVDKYSEDEKFQSLKKKQQDLFADNKIQKEYWNIVNSDIVNSKIDELKKRD